ncbi:formin-like protein 5 [Triticum aestivum]|uniref:formin-like protein 5 n=1 Tax=Triticum aestivum TaxID=4565 RepID=UPI000843A89C|nr:formin-like protein 5 [Triticum aestivum]
MSRHRHHHHDPAPPPCCSCCACGCSPPPCGYYAVPPPQPAPGSDQLLHAIAAHLLLSSAPPPPPQPQPHPQPHPQPPPNPAAHHANLYASYAYQHQHQHQQQPGSAPHAAYSHPPAAAPAPPPPQHQHQQPNPPDHGQLLLHSLLHRVAALETTLPHCFPSPPAPPHPQQPNPRRHHRAAHAHQEDPRSRSPSPPPPPPPRRARQGPPSERELAARTIQEHFRRFLARRSRTLRQLKELAMLRSKAASLRAALSGSGRRRCKDPMAVSEAALGMLYRLDGIQGGDPMIREGKHAVSRELGRILEFVDKVLLKEQEEMGVDGAFDDYPEGCHGMNRPTVNRKVSFRGNEANTEADESSESSSSAEADERKAANSKKSANGKPGLAAPVPVHMESRRTGGEM